MDIIHAIPAAIQLILQNPQDFEQKLDTHLLLTGWSLLIGIVVAFPLGVVASRIGWVSLYSLNGAGILRAIPSIALLFLAYPYLGIGFLPALLALAVLAIPPILINTSLGFRGVDPAIREAAEGMGMSTWQVLTRVELPLATPVAIAGLRTATVEVIASATLATFIGSGGLGDYIAEGLAVLNVPLMVEGALPVAVLTLIAELLLGGTERLTRSYAGVR
ncbi:MAG: ABC transporter permease [Chloroflexota bacterium]